MVRGKDDAAVKFLDKLCYFRHVGGAVGTADKLSVLFHDAFYFRAYARNIFAVKQDMIGDHTVKESIRQRNFRTVKGAE